MEGWMDRPYFIGPFRLPPGVQKEAQTQVFSCKMCEILKGALSGLRQVWATESHLKIMKNAFYFTLTALFVLKIFTFLSRLFLSCIKTA